jgi:hypothetical protein
MSANLRLGREIMRENMNRANRMAYMRNHPVEWEPGERERLIAEAIAQGKVTKCEPAVGQITTFFNKVPDLQDKAFGGFQKTARLYGAES